MTEIRCPKCNKLLFKLTGAGSVIEIQCTRCGALVRWPTLKPEVVNPSSPAKPVGPSEHKKT